MSPVTAAPQSCSSPREQLRRDNLRVTMTASVRIPSPRAHTIQILRNCEALAAAGAQVRLVLPRLERPVPDEEVWSTYGVEHPFPIVRLRHLDFQGQVPSVLEPLAFRLRAWTFALAALGPISRCDGVVHSRDLLDLFLALVMRAGGPARHFFLEVHDLPEALSPVLDWCLPRIGGAVVITDCLRQRLLRRGIDPRRVLVAPDGVKLEPFASAGDGSDFRRDLDLPMGARLVMYCGSLHYGWKGVDLLPATLETVGRDAIGVVVGGPEDVARDLQAGLSVQRRARMRFATAVPPLQVPRVLAAASVLVLPTRSWSPYGREFSSPMKLFEYMASGRPIVASDLPAIREVLANERNALLVAPDDPAVLAAAIARLLDDPELAHRLSSRAREDVERYTWNRRAASMLTFYETARSLEQTRVGRSG
ncbi:MAG: glycosyltransferase family 4 protein [Candidatus Riflebacteria bacterium]|nr:glycosyltransferase family 4 protein [Candidatus Riflebacteria bacterium]